VKGFSNAVSLSGGIMRDYTSEDKKNKFPPKDSFNRSIDYLRISVTDRCNLKCIYCKPKDKLKDFNKSDILTPEEIVRFVRIACKFGLKKVRITGGEPLLNEQIIPLIESIKKTGIRDLSLTTNGIMLAEKADDLKKAGLDRVNISLDTMNRDKYKTMTGGGDISAVWKSIERAEEAGLSPVKINVVPIRGLNDDEIVSFASLTLDRDYHVRFIEFMPSACGIWDKDRCVGSEEIKEKMLGLGELEKIEFKGKGPSRNYRINGAKGVIGLISPLTDHFCGFCNRLRLTADGKIRPCLFSDQKIDIRTPIRNGASDSEIEELFLSSVKAKPEKHYLHENKTSHASLVSMSQIGG
jgi:cyclic pyranopterin phosphate synthase